MKSDTEESLKFIVVFNQEEQYSIWPCFKPVPSGWKEAGFSGIKEDCLAYIKEVWKDMRPLSLRKKMAEREAKMKEAEASSLALYSTAQDSIKKVPSISPIVSYLSQGNHPVTTFPTNKTSLEFKESLNRNYIHLTFNDTQGNTCLGIKLDPQYTRLDGVDFEKPSGKVHVEGSLILDYVRVRCIADINLKTLEGTGHLEILEVISPIAAFNR